MPKRDEPALETITALGITGERRDALIDALRSGTWTQLPWVSTPLEPPADVNSYIGEAPHERRYELIELLGHGTSGAVYRARDHLIGEDVAIKVLRRASPKHIERMHREIAILRMLRLPGVVAFRDEGTWGDKPYIVMDLVRGPRFPGTSSQKWEDVAFCAVALTEALARIHQAGVTHGDLKPANVLTQDARPILLDFGLAQSDVIAIAEGEDLAGTPAYLAPEQFLGGEPNNLTDLYSLGAMIFEALAGRRPHKGETLHDVAMAVLFAAPPALGELAPNVPLGVQQVVMRLLSREPANRPQSASEVLRILRRGDLIGTPLIQRIGSRAPLNDALTRILDGHSVDIAGAEESGRTRLLVDLNARLSERGVVVARSVQSNSPFASLEPVIGDIGLDHEDLAAATEEAHRRLLERLEAGVVVIADDAEGLDHWTADLLEKSRGSGVIVRSTTGVGDVELAPISVTDLQALFAGPEAIHYLQSDGAKLLHQRAGEAPSQILDLVGCWVRAGIGRWEDGRLHVGRHALDRLRAGLRVDPLATAGSERDIDGDLAETWRAISLLHPWATPARIAQMTKQPAWALEGHLTALAELGVIREQDGRWMALARPPYGTWSRPSWTLARKAAADALPDHADERLLRLIESDQVELIPAAARAIAARHVAEGRPGVAWAILAEGLAFARRERLLDDIGPLLEDAVCVALFPNGPRLLAGTRLEISRSDPTDSRRLGRLCDLAQEAMSGGGVEIREALDALPPMDRPDVELWRYRLAAFAGLRGDLDDYEAWVDRARAAVADLPGGDRNANAWIARVRYRQRRYAEAAALHEELYESEPQPVHANASGLNAAIAWLEAERFDQVDLITARLQGTIPPRRTPVHGAMLATLCRTADYRRGLLPPRDHTYEAALHALGVPSRTAPALVTEAAACWRRGEIDAARDLAMQSASAWQALNRPWLWALMRSLAARCEAANEPHDLGEILAAADESPFEEIAIQTRALLCVEADLPTERIIGAHPGRYPAHARREVLSMYEARSLLQQT